MIIGNNIIEFEWSKRYYVEDLTKRDITLECATPHILKINDIELKENSWVELIRNLSAYLISTSNIGKEKILDFKTEWSKKKMFSDLEETNFKMIDDNLYVNCNHTADHSCWFIQDLLDYFNIDKSKVYFLIHRPPFCEPKDAKEFFKNKFKEEFSLLLKYNYHKDDISISKTLSNIENYMNPILAKLSKSYNDFMLFDYYLTFIYYQIKFVEEIDSNLRYSDKNKIIMKRYLEYLKQYYKLNIH